MIKVTIESHVKGGKSTISQAIREKFNDKRFPFALHNTVVYTHYEGDREPDLTRMNPEDILIIEKITKE